jgi:hypothetical protein
MTFHITHRYGAMERDPPLLSLASLLAELADRPEDTEHAGVSLTHESEWCMSVSRAGSVTLENLESGAHAICSAFQTRRFSPSGRFLRAATWRL